MGRGIDIGLFARPNLAPNGDTAAYLEIARMADQAGIHSISFGEHLVMAEDTSRYPYGPWRHAPKTAWMDPIVMLSAVAAVTTKLRLSTSILLAPLRPGLVLAKEAATLDVLSGGRVELGVGSGWQSEEYVGVGLRWEDRVGRFDLVVEQCRAAWGDQPFALPLDGGELASLTAFPVPVQRRIPIYYGVKASPANARRIAALGDGWTPVGVTPDQVRDGVAVLRSAFAAAGRDPDSLLVRVPLPRELDHRGRIDLGRMFEPAAAYVEAGATLLVGGFNHSLESLDEAAELITGLVDAAAGVPANEG